VGRFAGPIAGRDTPARLVWPHDLFLHDVLIRQQPQKTQLREAAERQFFIVEIAEPVPGCAMMRVSFCSKRNPNVDIKQVGHQTRTETGRAFPAALSGSPATLPRDRHMCLTRGRLEVLF
jgi:hypothetical protein